MAITWVVESSVRSPSKTYRREKKRVAIRFFKVDAVSLVGGNERYEAAKPLPKGVFSAKILGCSRCSIGTVSEECDIS